MRDPHYYTGNRNQAIYNACFAACKAAKENEQPAEFAEWPEKVRALWIRLSQAYRDNAANFPGEWKPDYTPEETAALEAVNPHYGKFYRALMRHLKQAR